MDTTPQAEVGESNQHGPVRDVVQDVRDGWLEVLKFVGLVLFVVAFGWLASNAGVFLFQELFSDRWTQDVNKHEERAALVVCGVCLAGLLLSLLNIFLLRWKKKISVTLPPSLDPLMRLLAAGLVGWLIGKTIFV